MKIMCDEEEKGGSVAVRPGRGENRYGDQLPDLRRSKCHLLLVTQVLECPNYSVRRYHTKW